MTFVDGQAGQLAFLNNINDPCTAYVPTLTNFVGAITFARFKQIGKMVDVEVQLTASGAATGTVQVSLPANALAASATAATPIGIGYINDGGVANYLVSVFLATTSTVAFSTNANPVGTFNATVPITLTNGDKLAYRIRYEAA